MTPNIIRKKGICDCGKDIPNNEELCSGCKKQDHTKPEFQRNSIRNIPHWTEKNDQ